MSSSKYSIPNSEIIEINKKELFHSPEILFNPSIEEGNENLPGILELILNSIKNCEKNIQPILFENIIISGGSSLFNGFESRLTNEISNKISNKKKIFNQKKIFTGGSILSN